MGEGEKAHSQVIVCSFGLLCRFLTQCIPGARALLALGQLLVTLVPLTCSQVKSFLELHICDSLNLK